MSLSATIITALAPIVFVTGLGWFAGARGILKPDASDILASFVIRFALPLSLFIAAAASKRDDILNPPLLATLFIGLIGAFAVGALTSRLFGHRPGDAGIQGLAGGCGNMAYCGPPVLAAVVGTSGTLAVVLGNLIMSIVMLPTALIFISHQTRRADDTTGGVARMGRSLRKVVTQPLFFLPVAGLLLALFDIRLPHIATDAIAEIGKSAGGVALFTLGLILSGIRFRLSRDVIANVAIKNFVQPALMLGVGEMFGLSGTPLKEIFLLGVLPTATAVPSLALTHNVYTDEAAASVLASTVVALITISAGIAIAEMF